MFISSFNPLTSTTTSFIHLSHLIFVILPLTNTNHPAKPPLFLILIYLTPNTNTSFITKLNLPFNIHLLNSFHNTKSIHNTTFNKLYYIYINTHLQYFPALFPILVFTLIHSFKLTSSTLVPYIIATR